MNIPSLLLALVLSAAANPGLFGRSDATVDDPAIVLQARSVAASDRMEAIAILEDYLAEGSNLELMPLVALNAGEQRRLAGDAASAREHFQHVARTWPDHGAKQAAALGLALLAYDSGTASGNTAATLELVDDPSVPSTMNADRFRLLALQKAQGGAGDSELTLLVENAFAAAEGDPAVEARVARSLAHLAPEDMDVSAGDGSIQDAADVLALEKARAALRADDYGRAADLARSVASTFPDSEHLLEAEWIAKRAAAHDPYDPLVIGVLLPLTGTYAPPGKQLKEALELGMDDSGGGVRLVFKDTAGSADQAVAAFEELVLQDGAAAVIGPLLADAAFPVANQAQAAGVPLVALTQSPGITETGGWVFRSFVTVEQQVDGLLDEVMDHRGMQNFAVLAPESDYGRLAQDEFLKQVTERGGTVSVAETYDPTLTDFRKDAAALGNKDYEARKGELYRLRKEAEDRGEDPSKVVLPPSIEFEAIFIPDSYGRVALVASALAYEEFAVGNFAPRKGAKNIPLLGLNGWHNSELFTRGGLYVQNCVFVDAFYPSDPAVSDFVRSYRDLVGRSPSVMDAIGYDTAKLVSVASRTRPEDREAFRVALAGSNLKAPVASGGRFDGDREVARELYVLTITRDVGIERVDAPPDAMP
jgi:branched-chain amino acid transport system substrate-binding protein